MQKPELNQLLGPGKATLSKGARAQHPLSALGLMVPMLCFSFSFAHEQLLLFLLNCHLPQSMSLLPSYGKGSEVLGGWLAASQTQPTTPCHQPSPRFGAFSVLANKKFTFLNVIAIKRDTNGERETLDLRFYV